MQRDNRILTYTFLWTKFNITKISNIKWWKDECYIVLHEAFAKERLIRYSHYSVFIINPEDIR